MHSILSTNQTSQKKCPKPTKAASLVPHCWVRTPQTPLLLGGGRPLPPHQTFRCLALCPRELLSWKVGREGREGGREGDPKGVGQARWWMGGAAAANAAIIQGACSTTAPCLLSARPKVHTYIHFRPDLIGCWLRLLCTFPGDLTTFFWFFPMCIHFFTVCTSFSGEIFQCLCFFWFQGWCNSETPLWLCFFCQIPDGDRKLPLLSKRNAFIFQNPTFLWYFFGVFK